MKLPLTLKKTDKVTVLRRPQTPKPPFPYKVEELTVSERAGGDHAGGNADVARKAAVHFRP